MKMKAYAVVVVKSGEIFEYSEGGGGCGSGPLIERCLAVNASEEGANAAKKFIEEEGVEKMSVVPVEITF